MDLVVQEWSVPVYVAWWAGVISAIFSIHLAVIILICVPMFVWHKPLWGEMIQWSQKTVKKKK